MDRYVGVDIDARSIEVARARHGDHFRVGDAGALDLSGEVPFDYLFVNSMLHHMDDVSARRLLSRSDLLTADGQLHLIDIYVPEKQGLPRRLALADRGEYPRPLAALRALIAEQWKIDVEESFYLKLVGVELWAMAYFRATPLRSA
jgi:SAM-dependent methyltransferase